MSETPIGYLLGSGAPPLPLFDGNVVTLGRDDQSTIPMDDATASRNHARIHCRHQAVQAEDLGSTNGTFVNGDRLLATEPFALQSGDEIRIGGKVFYFISTAAGPEPHHVALQRKRQFSHMQTLSWASPHHAVDEKVVAKQGPEKQTFPLAPSANTRRADGALAESIMLSGSLSLGSLPQILQFIHAGGMSGRLLVQCRGLNGSIYFLDGQLHAAQTGAQKGAEAVCACALEREGQFSFERLEPAKVREVARNIEEKTLQVVFECCRRIDEAGAESRPPS